MKKKITFLILILILITFVVALGYLYNKNKKSATVYPTKKLVQKEIVKKIIATGSIVPKEEIIIKPNVQGIIDQIYVEAGQYVKAGDLIAKIKVIPKAASISPAKNRLKDAKANLENVHKNFDRQKKLLDKKAISQKEFDASELSFKQAKINYNSAQENYDIIKTGTTSNIGTSANTLVKSTISGMVLEIPVKVGNQVIEANNFNEGTTIATLADINKMIFEGVLDESEIEKIKEGMAIKIVVGAIPDKKFDAVLTYIAPKGKKENNAVQFEIKCTLKKNDIFIRPGLSANASIILDRTQGKVLAIDEGLLQYDKEEKSFVEIQIGDQNFEKRYVEIGVSDGLFAEIKSGISSDDKIKVWSPPSKDSKLNGNRRR